MVALLLPSLEAIAKSKCIHSYVQLVPLLNCCRNVSITLPPTQGFSRLTNTEILHIYGIHLQAIGNKVIFANYSHFNSIHLGAHWNEAYFGEFQ